MNSAIAQYERKKDIKTQEVHHAEYIRSNFHDCDQQQAPLYACGQHRQTEMVAGAAHNLHQSGKAVSRVLRLSHGTQTIKWGASVAQILRMGTQRWMRSRWTCSFSPLGWWGGSLWACTGTTGPSC
jgi:hypothetical protein